MVRLIKLALMILISLVSIACESSEGINLQACEPITVKGGVFVIGGSIMEGKPSLYGRANGQCNNEPGQLSYYLNAHNMAKGGSSCAEVLADFNSNVLGLEPSEVWVNCGHNDFLKTNDPVNSILNSYNELKDLSIKHNFDIKIINLSYNEKRRSEDASIDLINTELNSIFGTDNVFDFNGWINNNQESLIDHIHIDRRFYGFLAVDIGL